MNARAVMKYAIFPIAFALAAPALAEPMCVGAGVYIPVPGATDVERGSADVASARFAGLWQEGRINGVVYRVYANRIGVVADDLISPTWRIEVFCDTINGECRQVVTGDPSEAASLVADGLALCMTGAPLEASDFMPEVAPEPLGPISADTGGEPSISSEPAAPVEPSVLTDPAGPPEPAVLVEPPVPVEPPAPAEPSEPPQPLAPVEQETDETEPPTITSEIPSCDTPLPSDENEQVREAQTILFQIGVDPGPIDGLIGPLTIAALVESLGQGAAGLTPLAALSALREAHCPG